MTTATKMIGDPHRNIYHCIIPIKKQRLITCHLKIQCTCMHESEEQELNLNFKELLSTQAPVMNKHESYVS